MDPATHPKVTPLRPPVTRCPTCGSDLGRAKAAEVTARLQREHEELLQEALFQAQLLVSAEAAEQLAAAGREKRAAVKRANMLEAELIKLRKNGEDAARRTVEAELQKQRRLFDKQHDQLALKQQAEFNRQREAWQKKVRLLERQLQQQRANELGDGAEIDLFEALRTAYPDDHITRVPKGAAGADITQEVRSKGTVCGRIVLDSKNCQAWQNGFVTKLRADREAAQADHAILSSTVFPRGRQELALVEEVIIASRERVVAIVDLLRQALIRMHGLRLSATERTDKMGALYAYITSAAYARHAAAAARHAGEISMLDTEEEKEHQRVWKRRERLTGALQKALRDIDAEVSAIIEADAKSA